MNAPRIPLAIVCTLLGALTLGFTGCDRSSLEVSDHDYMNDERRPTTPDRSTPARPGDKADQPAQNNKPIKRPGKAELLTVMASLAGESPAPDQIFDWVSYLQRGDQTLDDYIEFLLSSRRFGETVVPSLVFGSFVAIHNYYAVPSGFNLMQTKEGVYYLRKPCEKKRAVHVAPWWDLSTKVLVCPDSYRPEKWTLKPGEHDYRSKQQLTCDSQVGSPEKETHSLCGCGPNLIRCMKDSTHYLSVLDSLKREVKDTTAYVVEQDLPMSSLFTMNETVRDRNVEAHYRRRLIGVKQIEDVSSVMAGINDWPNNGQLAARAEAIPGQHAGLITSPQLLHFLPDRRQRQRGFYEMMWCANRSSFGATTEQVFNLSKNANLAFVHDSWQKLARTPVCTNCHARLDFGFQFFMGYPDSRASIHYMPGEVLQGSGPLYADDIDDHRGDTNLTPLGFTKLASAQPEFKQCMSNHFVQYVLGEHANADDIAAIEAEIIENQSFKGAMRVALRLYAEHWEKDRSPAPPDTLPGGAREDADTVKISGSLRSALDNHCLDCHNDDQIQYVNANESFGLAFDFQSNELPRPLIVRMTDHVAYGKMPKDNPEFSERERVALVELLIASLWSDEDKRATARQYYVDRFQALPAHNIDNALDNVVFRAGAERPRHDWGLYERIIYPDQTFVTPGYAATVALEAMSACRASGQREPALLRTCLRRALNIDMLTRWPLEDPTE